MLKTCIGGAYFPRCNVLYQCNCKTWIKTGLRKISVPYTKCDKLQDNAAQAHWRKSEGCGPLTGGKVRVEVNSLEKKRGLRSTHWRKSEGCGPLCVKEAAWRQKSERWGPQTETPGTRSPKPSLCCSSVATTKNQNISKNKMNVKGNFFLKRARERERERERERGQNILYHIHMTVLCVCYKTEVDERTNFVMITLFQWWLIAQLVRATAFLPSGFIRICDNDYRGLSVLLSAAVCLNACVLQ